MTSNECYSGSSNSIYLPSGTILSTSVITAIFSAILAAIIMRLFCEVKCKTRNKTTSSTQFHDRTPPNAAAGPLYEEVELNKNLTLNSSKKVAYHSTFQQQHYILNTFKNLYY